MLDKGRKNPEASVSGGRAVWFPQTTLNEVVDKNLKWGTDRRWTEYSGPKREEPAGSSQTEANTVGTV